MNRLESILCIYLTPLSVGQKRHSAQSMCAHSGSLDECICRLKPPKKLMKLNKKIQVTK